MLMSNRLWIAVLYECRENSVKGKEFIQCFHIKTDLNETPFLAFPLHGIFHKFDCTCNISRNKIIKRPKGVLVY